MILVQKFLSLSLSHTYTRTTILKLNTGDITVWLMYSRCTKWNIEELNVKGSYNVSQRGPFCQTFRPLCCVPWPVLLLCSFQFNNPLRTRHTHYISNFKLGDGNNITEHACYAWKQVIQVASSNSVTQLIRSCTIAAQICQTCAGGRGGGGVGGGTVGVGGKERGGDRRRKFIWGSCLLGVRTHRLLWNLN